jgi:leucyl aminopeptidase
VLGQAECEARKMGAYLAVAQGSKDGPEFIHLSYKPKAGACVPSPLWSVGRSFGRSVVY